jgi:glycosyltransferase involved in cell wall biosynthesis
MVQKHIPRISLGMPVFNGASYLAKAIDSILTQTVTDFELIICDNASTDETEALCREYASRDKRICYHRNTTNLGAHPNYNKTFELSCGEFFKWTPHDDVLHPQYLQKCLAAMEADPDCVVSQSYLHYINSNGDTIGYYDSALIGTDSHSPARRLAGLLLRPHPSYEVMGLYRRSALERTQLLESFHGADRSLLAELTLLGSFTQVKEPLLLVRDHNERYTRAQVRPKDRAHWHDTRLNSRFTFPTWRLYGEYWAMLPRLLPSRANRLSCSVVLLAWWGRNWNAARMFVDVVAAFFPDAVYYAERFKGAIISPPPGADTAVSDIPQSKE